MSRIHERQNFVTQLQPDPVFLGGMDGENVIYLGGSLEDDNFNTFAEEANFWGHGFPISKLNQMMIGLQEWADAPVVLENIRCDLSQDNLEE